MEGKGGCVGKRGQGCFLFSQLIDSQMSGGVVFVAGLKHPVTLFPTNTTPMHTHACMHAPRTCGLSGCFLQTQEQGGGIYVALFTSLK